MAEGASGGEWGRLEESTLGTEFGARDIMRDDVDEFRRQEPVCDGSKSPGSSLASSAQVQEVRQTVTVSRQRVRGKRWVHEESGGVLYVFLVLCSVHHDDGMMKPEHRMILGSHQPWSWTSWDSD